MGASEHITTRAHLKGTLRQWHPPASSPAFAAPSLDRFMALEILKNGQVFASGEHAGPGVTSTFTTHRETKLATICGPLLLAPRDRAW